MNTVRKRAGIAVLIVLGIILSYAIFYRWAMMTFEGESVTIFKALQVVIESITTAGFGGHAPWDSTILNLFVIMMNLTGVAIVFVGVPLVLVPFLHNIASEPPKQSSKSGHVIIASYDSHDEILREELDAEDIPYVVVESDKEKANMLDGRDVPVIQQDAQTVAGLEAANINEAKAIVADMDDELNPTVLLSAEQANSEAKRISVVSEDHAATYNKLAGATEVVRGKHELGTGLGLQATTSLPEEFVEALSIAFEGELTELIVKDGSSLCGKTIKEAAENELENNVIIGGWFNRKFIVSPHPEQEIPRNSVLWTVGEFTDGHNLETRQVDPSKNGESVVVCGYGNVGEAVVEQVEAAGFEAIVVDDDEMENVDIVGDIAEPQTFSEIDFDDVRAVVLAINDDAAAIYTSLILSNINSNIDIIARANSTESVWKLYHAGATRVLSLADVTGESLAALLIDNEQFFTPNVDFEFVSTTAPALRGQTLAEADIRKETGCKVAAIERDGDLITDVSADTEIQEKDVLIAAGTDETIEQFETYTLTGSL